MMKSSSGGSGRGRLAVVGVVCVLCGLAAGLLANSAKQMVVAPLQDAKFVPADPKQPDGTRWAVLWGDPATGPSAMLLELKKGRGPLHTHSSDYHLAMIEGTMKHWDAATREEDAKPLGPGSYWFQPGKQPHRGTCLTDKCLMFVKWEGKRDGTLVEEPTRD